MVYCSSLYSLSLFRTRKRGSEVVFYYIFFLTMNIVKVEVCKGLSSKSWYLCINWIVMSKDVNNGQSRREFLGRSVAALAAASFLPSAFSCTGKSVIRRRRQARLTRSSVACKSARSLIVGVPCRVDWRISSSIAKRRISVPSSWWEVIWKLI